MSKVSWKPTPEVLRATEALLVAMGVQDGKTFHGVGDGSQFTPQDPRVLWVEAGGEPGVWNMVFIP